MIAIEKFIQIIRLCSDSIIIIIGIDVCIDIGIGVIFLRRNICDHLILDVFPSLDSLFAEINIESARVNYALPSDWQPDALVLRLIDRYHEDKSGVAGEALETILRAIHNSSRAANIISERLSDKLNSGLQAEDALPFIDLVTKLNGIINIIPTQMKSLNEAKQAAALEVEQKKARGGKVVTSSMSAKDASDLEAQVEAQKRELGLISDSIVNAPLRGKYESTK